MIHETQIIVIPHNQEMVSGKFIIEYPNNLVFRNVITIAGEDQTVNDFKTTLLAGDFAKNEMLSKPNLYGPYKLFFSSELDLLLNGDLDKIVPLELMTKLDLSLNQEGTLDATFAIIRNPFPLKEIKVVEDESASLTFLFEHPCVLESMHFLDLFMQFPDLAFRHQVQLSSGEVLESAYANSELLYRRLLREGSGDRLEVARVIYKSIILKTK